MQMPKPTKAHAKLEAFVGDWSGEEKMHPSPWDPEARVAKGTMKVRGDLDGFGIVQHYTQKSGGKVSYRGIGVMGYDATEKRYVWHWSDSMGGVPGEVTRGDWKGNKVTFQHGGPMGHVRYTYTFHKDGTLGFRIDNSADGSEWAPFMEGRYTRKSKG